jgi:hypothetical protein
MSSRRYKTVGWILLILALSILLLYLVRLVIVLMEQNSHASSSLPVSVERAKVTPGQGWGIGGAPPLVDEHSLPVRVAPFLVSSAGKRDRSLEVGNMPKTRTATSIAPSVSGRRFCQKAEIIALSFALIDLAWQAERTRRKKPCLE